MVRRVMALAIGLISNRNSGRNRNPRQWAALERLVARYPYVHHCVTTERDELSAALQTLAQKKIDVLAINGGDGTFDQVMRSAVHESGFARLPPIVLLPGGTANMLVGDVGTRGRLPVLLRRLCQLTAADLRRPEHPIKRLLLCVRPYPDADPLYGMCFSIGVIMQGVAYAHRHVHARGIKEAGPLLATLRVLWGLYRKDPRFDHALPVAVRYNNTVWQEAEQQWLLVVSTLHRLFAGLQPFWGNEAGALRMTAIRYGAKHKWRALWSWLVHRPSPVIHAANGYHSANISCVDLRFDGGFIVDGECYQADARQGPVTISLGPELTFIRL